MPFFGYLSIRKPKEINESGNMLSDPRGLFAKSFRQAGANGVRMGGVSVRNLIFVERWGVTGRLGVELSGGRRCGIPGNASLERFPPRTANTGQCSQVPIDDLRGIGQRRGCLVEACLA